MDDRPPIPLRPITPLQAALLALWLLPGAGLASAAVAPVLPEQFAGSTGQQSGALPDARWFDHFGVPELTHLIETARTENPDYAAAAARSREADAQLRGVRADRLPVVDATLGGTHYAGHSGAGTLQETDSGASLTASFDPDLSGRRRAQIRSATASAEAAHADEARAALILDTAVASGYLDLQLLRERQQLADDDYATAKAELDLVLARSQAGTLTPADVAQALSRVASAGVAVQTLTEQASEARLALAERVGLPPQSSSVPAHSLSTWVSPPIGAGLPADLLRRRADIRSAEAALAAADADVDVARAALWPSLALTLTGGVQNPSVQAAVATLTGTGPSLAIGASLIQSVFDGGRRRAVRELADARASELLYAYQATIRTALIEVETALSARTSLLHQAEHQQTVLEVADHALAVAKARAAAGSVDITGVHEAMRALAAARADALQYRRDLLLSDINLIRALGGGWSASPPPSIHPNTSGSP